MLTPGFERASQDAHYAQFRVYTTPGGPALGPLPLRAAWSRLLSTAAGAPASSWRRGGRELFALLAMGYTVHAYSPSRRS